MTFLVSILCDERSLPHIPTKYHASHDLPLKTSQDSVHSWSFLIQPWHSWVLAVVIIQQQNFLIQFSAQKISIAYGHSRALHFQKYVALMQCTIATATGLHQPKTWISQEVLIKNCYLSSWSLFSCEEDLLFHPDSVGAARRYFTESLQPALTMATEMKCLQIF